MSNRTKKNICDELGISLATVNNWIKTGIIPSPDALGEYREETYHSIIKDITITSKKLSGRANRSLVEDKLICYLGISDKDRRSLLAGLVATFEKSELTVSEGVLALVISVLKSNALLGEKWEFSPQTRIEKILNDWAASYSHNIEAIKALFSHFFVENKDDDIVGAFYQSLQSIAQKSSLGSYYTPAELLTGISVEVNKLVLDPCCGSGGILLRILHKEHDSSKVYARDIDPVALKICAINLALFFNDPDFKSVIEAHDILKRKEGNLFAPADSMQFDYIVTNPPWGSKLSKAEKDNLVESYHELATSETFAVALNNGIDALTAEGELHFFLPYSILNVATHKNIRKKLLALKSVMSIQILGNAFPGVLSEAILLHLSKPESKDEILIEGNAGSSYSLKKSTIAGPNFIFPSKSSSLDDIIIDKIYGLSHTTLKTDTVFALGVVTGNNGEYIKELPSPDMEPIFRGKDILAYRYAEPACYIDFKPGNYQQVAPIDYYRQRKIVYRFISDRITCALDSENSLLLNSANLFIPNHYPMESVVCLFNSPVYTYLYRKKFHSRKVLKSHLQDFPLPLVDGGVHKKLKNIHDLMEEGCDHSGELNRIVGGIFSFTEEELSYVIQEVK